MRLCACLEEARQDKGIGKGLEAELEITASGDHLTLLQRHAAGLKEAINVSACQRWLARSRKSAREGSARQRPQMRPLLELHARSRRLRHLAECLHALPGRAERDGHCPAAARRRPPSELCRAPPTALAARTLRADSAGRPTDQNLGRRPRADGRSDSDHSARPAHHALDQRGRGLLALCRLRIAAHGSLDTDLVFAARGGGGSDRHDPPRQAALR